MNYYTPSSAASLHDLMMLTKSLYNKSLKPVNPWIIAHALMFKLRQNLG